MRVQLPIRELGTACTLRVGGVPNPSETRKHMGLFDLKAERHESLNKAEAIVNAATNRPLIVDEQRIFDAHMAEANRLGTKIEHA